MSINHDSLKVSEDSDGSFIVEWDRNDPRYKQFNDMSSEEFEIYVNKILRTAIDEYQLKEDLL